MCTYMKSSQLCLLPNIYKQTYMKTRDGDLFSVEVTQFQTAQESYILLCAFSRS